MFIFSGSEDGSFWRWPLFGELGYRGGATMPGVEVGRLAAPVVCVCTAVGDDALVTGGGVAVDGEEGLAAVPLAGHPILPVEPAHVWACHSAGVDRSLSPLRGNLSPVGSGSMIRRLSMSPKRVSPLSPNRGSPLAGAGSPPSPRQWGSMFSSPRSSPPET